MKVALVGAVVAAVVALSGCTIAIPLQAPNHGAIAPAPLSHVYADPAALHAVTTIVFGANSLTLRSRTGVVESLQFTESKVHAIAVLKTVLGQPLNTTIFQSLPASYSLSWKGFFASYSDAETLPGRRQWFAMATESSSGHVQLATTADVSVGESIASVRRLPGVLVKHEAKQVILAIPNDDGPGFLVFNEDLNHPGRIGQIRSLENF